MGSSSQIKTSDFKRYSFEDSSFFFLRTELFVTVYEDDVLFVNKSDRENDEE